MKKINSLLIMLLTLISLGACNNSTSTNDSHADTIGTERTNNIVPLQTKIDSCDLEEIKVIGDLKFGMRKNVADKIIENFKRDGQSGYGYYIGKCKYDNMTGFYSDDSLYQLVIKCEGKPIAGEIISKALGGPMMTSDEQFYGLSELLESKYGKPTFDTIKLFSGLHSHSKEWSIGKKKIELHCSSSEKEGNLYFRIYLPDALNRAHQKRIDHDKHITDSIANSVFK